MNNAEATLSEALAALNNRDIRKAEEGFRKVLRADASHIAALNLLAVVLMSSGRFAEAESFIARAVKLNRSSDVSFYNYGLIAKQLNKPQLACQQFTNALNLNPNVPETWNNRGTVFNDLKQYAAAISDFNTAIKLSSNYAEAHANKGKSLLQLKRYDEALAAYDKAVAIKPGLAEALLGRGNVLAGLKRSTEALAAYDRALSVSTDLADAWLGLGNALADLERYDDAFAAYSRALSIRPDLENAWLGQGNVLASLKRPDEAFAAYEKALSIRPDLANAWLGRGNLLANLKRHDEAFAAYEKALSIESDLANAWLGRGNVFWKLKRYDEASAAYDKALSIESELEGAWLGRGNVFHSLKRYDEAMAAYDKALSIQSELEGAWLGRGNVFHSLKRYDEAMAAYDKALSIRPDSVNALLGRGNVFWNLKRYDEALAACDKALSIEPDMADAWLGRGNAFSQFKRHDEALNAYEKALLIEPELSGAWLGRGNVFWDLKRREDALAAYDKALSIQPDLEYAWLGRANVLSDLKRFDDAFAAYDKAFTLDRELVSAEGARIYTKLNYCNWLNIDVDTASIIDSIRRGSIGCGPFVALTIDVPPEDQLRCADVWIQKNVGTVKNRIASAISDGRDKIRIGYLSADFRTHPVGYLTAGLFESHNNDRFVTFGFSVGPSDQSDLRLRIEASFDEFFDLNGRNDGDVLNAIRSANIDILIDLSGCTEGGRLAVLAQRPAPIMVNYLGFSGTVGGDLLDYIIADEITIPDDNAKFFSEKIVRLPHCFMPHDGKGRLVSDRLFARSDEGLPEDGFVFCCFNNAYKISPAVFKSWMHILRHVDGSVVWLSELPDLAKINLRKEAEKYGVEPSRLVFSKRIASSSDHLARHRLADLFLDTLPYNAHTTAGDALWAGLPVLTQIGNTFAGRVAAALLNAIGLPELITHSREEYETLAIELAHDPERIRAIREKLGKNRLSSSVFDTPLFTKHLEAAYEAMYRRYQAGLPPDHIEITQ